jgi:transcriptional regulator with XRE-family HTH domain
MEDMPDIVAANLRRLRREKGLTQEELADLADLDRSYLGAIERAEYKVTVVTLGKLAKGLRVLPAALVELPPRHPHLRHIAKKP